jgi:hypothetical protein
MRQFRHGDCAERDFRLTYFRKDHFQELGDVEMPALAFDHNAEVENYSQNGGFHMARCAAKFLPRHPS